MTISSSGSQLSEGKSSPCISQIPDIDGQAYIYTVQNMSSQQNAARCYAVSLYLEEKNVYGLAPFSTNAVWCFHNASWLEFHLNHRCLETFTFSWETTISLP